MNAYESTRDFWKSKNICTEEALSAALSNYFVLFAYHNCLLEDMEVSSNGIRAVFDNDKPINGDSAPRLLQNQKSCFSFLLPKAAAGEAFSVELLHAVNGMLSEGIDVETEEDDDAYLSPEELAEALNTLVSEVNAYDGPEALKAAAYFEAKLEYLQPFHAVNGLTARVLVNYFLLIRKEPPFVFFENDAERYFDALESYDIGEDIIPMQKLMREETVETWKTLLSVK